MHQRVTDQALSPVSKRRLEGVPSSIEAFVEQRLAELEERMHSYVDGKVAEVMKHIEQTRNVSVVGITGHEHSAAAHSERLLQADDCQLAPTDIQI